MQINWNNLAPLTKSSVVFNEWKKLKQYFGKTNVTHLRLIEYHLFYHYPGLLWRYSTINKAIRCAGVSIPPQYATYLVKPSAPSLIDAIKYIKSISRTHTAYAIISASLYYPISKLSKMQMNDFADSPKWLSIIIERQNRIAKNVYSDVLFNNYSYYDIEMIYNAFQSRFGLTWHDYVKYHRLFSGLQENSFIIYAPTEDNRAQLAMQKKRIIHACVTVYSISNKKRIVYDDGFCLQEIEPGIYLVHGTKGIYIVPAFLIDTPTFSVTEKSKRYNRILSLNYLPTDRKFTNRHAFPMQKVQLRKL